MHAAQLAPPIADAAAMTTVELAIARSVLYAGLFDYPLTLAQLRETLIESAQTPTEILAAWQRSVLLGRVIECRDGFFFPVGRSELVAERRRREASSRRFLASHRALLRLVAAMPYVKLLALSGSLAHMNLDGDGDLDLFIVTRGRHAWSVVVAVIVLAKLLGCRKTVCANFALADSALALEDHDLFTASQIVHLKPVVGTGVHREFVAANPFVARFFPNFHVAAHTPFALPSMPGWAQKVRRAVEVLGLPFAAVVEAACRCLYRSYLLRRRASWRSPAHVRLDRDCVKLHTRSHRASVLARFDRAAGLLLRS